MSYNTAPHIVLEVAEAAYLAGLIDGEGSIALWGNNSTRNKNGRSYRPVIEISNTHLGVLEWVKMLAGDGWLKQTNYKNARIKNHKPLYRFRFRTTDLHWVLPQIRPYLKIKGAQADLLMRYFQSVQNTRPSDREILEDMWSQSRELNHRGVAQEIA